MFEVKLHFVNLFHYHLCQSKRLFFCSITEVGHFIMHAEIVNDVSATFGRSSLQDSAGDDYRKAGVKFTARSIEHASSGFNAICLAGYRIVPSI